MNAIDFRGIAYLAALGLGAAIVYQVVRQGKAAGQAVVDVARQVVDSINPASPDNVFAKTADAVTQAVTGEKDVTLGTKLAEWLNPDVRRADAAMNAPPAPRVVYPGLDAELRAGAPRSWEEELAYAWEGMAAESARQGMVYTGPGGAAFGLYPGMR